MATAAVVCLAVLGSGCGHAETAGGVTHASVSADVSSPPVPGVTAPAPRMPDAHEALCRPADVGSLRARLQGAIDTELDWSAPATPQCLGGVRPTGAGLRLLYKGSASGQPLLVVIGIALAQTQGTFRNVPANVTIVREGTGTFYATQGDDKCAFDEVALEPMAGAAGRYRLSGRGYCTQPARALSDTSGVVLISRFDVDALVDEPKE